MRRRGIWTRWLCNLCSSQHEILSFLLLSAHKAAFPAKARRRTPLFCFIHTMLTCRPYPLIFLCFEKYRYLTPPFDRPGFTAMMEEVEAGNVEAIIVKDMSRLGRDYLKVGQIMEILRQRGVRLIAINDGVDSQNGENDFTPFLNIM